MSTSTDPIIEVAVNDGYFNTLTQSEKSSMLMDPATWVESHPFIQSTYIDLWNAYQANLNDHGTGYAQTTSNGNTSPTGTAVSFGQVPAGGVSYVPPNPAYDFTQMFPEQAAQMTNLGAADTQLSNYVNQLAAGLQAFENNVNPKLTNLGSADSTLSTDLNNEITYINTKFANIDAQLSRLGTSVSQASSAGSNPFSSITNFLTNPFGLGSIGMIVILVVIIMIFKR